MGYIVVTSADKKSGPYHVVAVDEKTYSVIGDYGMVTEAQIVQFMRSGSGNDIQPLNFSIDRNGKLVQDCGDFGRFSLRGSAVVLAEIKSKAGRTLGYRLLSCANNACVNLRLEEILQREKSMGDNEHFLQNGIIRNNTVNCYPMHPFPVMMVDGAVKKPAKRPTKDIPKQENPPVKTQAAVQRKHHAPLSQAQSREAELCKQRGISPKLISNPDLTPEQMRVLWVSKSKGCIAESFADPRYSADVMKFYADRLHDEQTVEECKEMLEHPELTPDQLSELYACVCQGVPYSDLIGLSPTDISVKREMAVAEYWGDQTYFDSTYLEKAANLAMRLHQGL